MNSSQIKNFFNRKKIVFLCIYFLCFLSLSSAFSQPLGFQDSNSSTLKSKIGLESVSVKKQNYFNTFVDVLSRFFNFNNDVVFECGDGNISDGEQCDDGNNDVDTSR